MTNPNKKTIPKLLKMKAQSEKIVCLTAYDTLLASLLDASNVDLILVGDSAAMVFAGHETTLPITMDQMIYHTQMVTRGTKNALVIADMPFLSYQTSPEDAILNAGRLMKEGHAEGVKLEGGSHMADTVLKLTERGIPVMGHLGLTPQSIRFFGDYRVRGKQHEEAERLKNDAKILEEAGAFSMVLEKIPAQLAKEISESVNIPTIGIGAGPDCDGQILVTYDMLGMFEAFNPKFVRQYAKLGDSIRDAVSQYTSDVRNNSFPNQDESY